MSRTLHVAPSLTLPSQAVTETFGILAVRGAGKSNTAAVMAEEMFAAKLPFVVVDPVRAWWGLRASRDGTGPGLPIPIFGGRRGDVPLERGGGNLMADLIVDQRLSCVLDISDFDSEGAKKAFLLDFARRLYQRNEQPLHLFLEEADDYIPQRPMRDEAQLLRAWENIVRRGRSRGLGITLITQRSAAINKNVLTQVQTLIAMRTTGPQDIAAIKEWVKYHQQSEDILASLAELKDGEAWVWSPQLLGKTVRVLFRRRETFDSGATPKMGEGKAPATLADIDLADVKKRMAATIEKAKQEDPRELRRRIAELEAASRKTPQPVAKVATPKRVEVPVLKDAHLKRIEATVCKAEVLNERTIKALVEMVGAAHELLREVRQAASGLRPQAGPGLVRGESPTFDWGQRTESELIKHSPPARIPAARVKSATASDLPKAERAILTVLAQSPDGSEGGRLALLAGYRWSGGFRNALSTLRTSGYLAGENSGVMRITTEGLAVLGEYDPLPKGRDLIDYWLQHPSFGKCERAILQALLDAYPKGLPAADLAAAAGYEWSGGFRNSLSTLRTAGLLRGKNSETMHVADALF